MSDDSDVIIENLDEIEQCNEVDFKQEEPKQINNDKHYPYHFLHWRKMQNTSLSFIQSQMYHPYPKSNGGVDGYDGDEGNRFTPQFPEPFITNESDSDSDYDSENSAYAYDAYAPYQNSVNIFGFGVNGYGNKFKNPFTESKKMIPHDNTHLMNLVNESFKKVFSDYTIEGHGKSTGFMNSQRKELYVSQLIGRVNRTSDTKPELPIYGTSFYDSQIYRTINPNDIAKLKECNLLLSALCTKVPETKTTVVGQFKVAPTGKVIGLVDNSKNNNKQYYPKKTFKHQTRAIRQR